MRSPEHRQPAPPRAGKNFEVDLHLRYLSPGAFTVLPPNEVLPDPPKAPNPHRLTPTSRRSKNQSFAIIGEVNTSRPGSRSSSPTNTGRVSPFRGHGFNPAGSRLASPIPSPPPEDVRLTPTVLSPKHSKIPQYARRGSTSAFGEKVSHIQIPPSRRKLHHQLSQSLTDLETTKVGLNRPPPSPRRNPGGHSKPPAFQRLSPIVGSSPEPSQSLSSPSRIPKSRSQPPSRITSPTRNSSSVTGKPPQGKGPSRGVSRTPSRATSRDPSPTKGPTSPTRIPVKNFRNVQAKVNSFSRPKPKVPPKPQVLSEQSDSDVPIVVTRKLNRNDSVNNNRLRTTSRSNLLSKNVNSNNNNNSNSSNKNNSGNNNSNNNKNSDNNNSGAGKLNTNRKSNVDSNKNRKDPNANTVKPNRGQTSEGFTTTTDASNNTQTTTSNSEDEMRKSDSTVKLTDLLQPSATTVVSSTTTTVTQPLKIDAKIDAPVQFDKPKPVSPMVDGRVLSATSVSNAMNRMNDTVLNTQTLIKDHGFSKLSPAANAVISMAQESKSNNPAIDTKNATTALPSVEPVPKRPSEMTNNNNNVNHVTHSGILDSRALEMQVQQNMNRLISPDHIMGNSVQKSVNDRIIEARTVVAADVKPIRINVREKPSEIEVQSGNVRLPVSATNGLNERPGLPPSNHTPPNEQSSPETTPKKTNACSRFFTSCRNKVPCKCCKKESKPKKEKDLLDDDEQKTGCFKCLSKKKPKEQVRINIEGEEPKQKFLDRLKCCGKGRVGDSSCFPTGKRKDSWGERRDSILSDVPPPGSKCSKNCYTDVLRKIFCLNLCCKKKVVQEPSRKASVISSSTKKKSLTPTAVPPPEDTKPKLDMSLVEHTSHMKGAIPVLPVYLAWFCLVMNCIAPGTGTVFSGMFCLCIGIPRFSQKDGPKPRIGSFIINLFIGFGQFFTVLFCLVGWGWSIWWGVIMLKVAKKHRKIKQIEAIEEASNRPVPSINQNHHNQRDPERGS